jgi:hypothetical protein
MRPGKTPTESEVPETTARATQHGPCRYSRRLPDCDSTDESILRSSMKGCRVQMSKNGSPTGTAPKKARRRPRWLGPLPEDPMYRRMRKALIREIAPETVLDWVEAEECVMSQYQSMRFRHWQKAIWKRCHWAGIKRAVKSRLRQRCPSDPEDELEWKAGRLWPTMASSIEPAEIEVETFLHRQPDLDSIARRDATALRRRDAALRHIEQRRSRRKKEEAQSQKIAATRSMNGKGEGPVVEPTALEELPIAADRNHQNGHG